MALTSAELDTWACAYIEAQLLPERELKVTHPLWWAVDRFMNLSTFEQAEDSWRCIVEVLSRTNADAVVGVLAAGPLEDLIHLWGEAFIDRIEVQAQQNAAFGRILQRVWESGDPGVWARVVAARGSDAA